MATNIILVHCRFMVGVIRNDFPWPIRVQTFISPAHLANHCTSCKKEIGGNQAASADWCLQDLLDHVRHCDFRVLLKHTGHQAIAAYVINALPSITRGGRGEREGKGVKWCVMIKKTTKIQRHVFRTTVQHHRES